TITANSQSVLRTRPFRSSAATRGSICPNPNSATLGAHPMTFAKAAILAASVLAAAPAFAQSANKQVTVSFADLNLDNPAGIQVLMGRIAAAARAVCGPQPTIRDLRQLGAYNDCVKDATDRAVASVGSPRVAETYRATVASR